MPRLLRRLLVLAILGAAIAAAVRALRASRAGELGGADLAPATWPPISERAPASTPAAAAEPADATKPTAATAWIVPTNGSCPDGYPIKVASSGIYHVPGGQFYDRTVAERCYASTEAAEADGYRAAKR
jgi:hypothetical protein